MAQPMTAPLAEFVGAVPMPRRLAAAEHDGRITVHIRVGAHRIQRDLPETRIWGYDGTIQSPTIETERGRPITVQWRNEPQARARFELFVARYPRNEVRPGRSQHEIWSARG
jgi:hypothetical protein